MQFLSRHVGPSDKDIAVMLKVSAREAPKYPGDTPLKVRGW
jgi:hypothetical protein